MKPSLQTSESWRFKFSRPKMNTSVHMQQRPKQRVVSFVVVWPQKITSFNNNANCEAQGSLQQVIRGLARQVRLVDFFHDLLVVDIVDWVKESMQKHFWKHDLTNNKKNPYQTQF